MTVAFKNTEIFHFTCRALFWAENFSNTLKSLLIFYFVSPHLLYPASRENKQLAFVLPKFPHSLWQSLLRQDGFKRPGTSSTQFVSDHVCYLAPTLGKVSLTQCSAMAGFTRNRTYRSWFYPQKSLQSPSFQPLVPLPKHLFCTDKDTDVRTLLLPLQVCSKGCNSSSGYHFIHGDPLGHFLQEPPLYRPSALKFALVPFKQTLSLLLCSVSYTVNM